MSKQYFPSNATEGAIFQALFCYQCYKHSSCFILQNSMFGKEPKQWVYDDNEKPTCTSFASERPKKKRVKPISNLFKSADVKVQGD